MNNKKRILLMISVMFLGISISFAYYVVKYIFNGEGAKIDTTTIVLEDSTVTVEGNIDLGTGSDIAEVMPGHKFASKIKVTATGPDAFVMYNLIWTGNDDYGNNGKGVNNLSTPLNYTVYRTKDSTIEVDIKCYEKQGFVDNLLAISEICNVTNEDELGEAVATGQIPVGKNTVTLALDEEIISTNAGTVVYYHIIVEYPDTNTNQSADMELTGNVIEGIVTVEASKNSGAPGDAKDVILLNIPNIIETEPDFSEAATEETIGVIYKEVIDDTSTALTNATTPKVRATLLSETEDNVTYYFRGAPTDNYVKFAGFYWRIIRINENGSIRMIYAGDAEVIDALTEEKDGITKYDVLANGYDDSVNEVPYTQIGSSKFNNDRKVADTEFLGSLIKDMLDKWYEDNLIAYTGYMDEYSGFCSDDSYSSHGYCRDDGGVDGCWDWVDYYDYGSYIRLYSNIPNPTFKCPNSWDLNTVNNDLNVGNRALTYPIGLITADEVAYAGGVFYNAKHYLNTGNRYWTISPAFFDGEMEGPQNFAIHEQMYHESPIHSLGVRPVINLSPNVSLGGNGTIESPYVVAN
ncbi:MAG: hypothetical protein E7163_05795 [Firmicutes bacterium]|nr:hypothetical protein [Bacillota bacterium]